MGVGRRAEVWPEDSASLGPSPHGGPCAGGLVGRCPRAVVARGDRAVGSEGYATTGRPCPYSFQP